MKISNLTLVTNEKTWHTSEVD
uniref:Uncharacterized protein n=1 Tax=Anguilla anguilla TaxID=7936 RepID=A0A0E9URB6_ANGAN